MGHNNIAGMFHLHIESAKLSMNMKWLTEEKSKAAREKRRPKRTPQQSEPVTLWEPPPIPD